MIIYIFGRKLAESGKDNIKSILSPVHICLEFLTWDKQTFEFKPIRKLLTTNYHNVLQELLSEWPKLAKNYIIQLDERLNQQPSEVNDSVDIDFQSDLAPDLKARLMLSQNSEVAKELSIEDELKFYENELGSRFLSCKYNYFIDYAP